MSRITTFWEERSSKKVKKVMSMRWSFLEKLSGRRCPSCGKQKLGLKIRDLTILSGGRCRVAVVQCANLDLSLIHISEPTRLLSISYAVFCLKKKNTKT